MDHKLWPVLVGVLGVHLVRVNRHLREAQAELRLLRAAVEIHQGIAIPVVTARRAAPDGRPTAAAVSAATPADFSDWEQAVPPMDS